MEVLGPLYSLMFDLRIFERSGHSVLADECDAFIDVVRGFLTYTRTER